MADGRLKVPSTVLPLEQAHHAHDLLRSRQSVGKIILNP
jgi:NADPH:quinone reductase-like Zn-dependent oxidoreductase